jgi:hypothetical protein
VFLGIAIGNHDPRSIWICFEVFDQYVLVPLGFDPGFTLGSVPPGLHPIPSKLEFATLGFELVVDGMGRL